MKLKLITLLFLSLLCSCATKHNDNSITFKGDHISNDFSILLSDINIVSVNENKVFPHKNVLIESGEIKQILDREELEHFAADRIINGKGKYLLAGLADMHTHLGVELDTASQIGKLEALQFLNNGVTTILNLGDFLETINDNAIFQLKDKILANKEIGPYIYTALYAREQGNGQLHQQVNSFEDGVKFVEEVEKSDYDLVKIYTFTPQEAVKGILKESTKRNIGVAGHLSRPAKLKTLISKNGIDLIAHTSEILYTFCNAKGDNYGTSPSDISFEVNRDTALFEHIAAQIKQAGTYLTPTLYINTVSTDFFHGDLMAYEKYFSEKGNQNAHPLMQEVWRERFMGVVNPFFKEEIAQANNAYEKKLVKYLADRDVSIMTGSDCEFAFGAAGYSIHKEMQEMKKAGLTNQQILLATTTRSGQFMNQFKAKELPFGKVNTGFRADLLILPFNPLNNIDSLQNFDAVIARGNYFKKSYLQHLEDSISNLEHKRYGDSLLDKVIRVAFQETEKINADSLYNTALNYSEEEIERVQNAFRRIGRDDIVAALKRGKK